MTRRWLDTLARVRATREDAARADAARAEMAAEVHRRAAAVLQVRLDRPEKLPPGTAAAFVGTAVAQAATARGLSAAVAAWQDGLVDQATARDVLRAAATARKTVDRLAERQAEDRAAVRQRVEQAAVDEVAGTPRQRP